MSFLWSLFTLRSKYRHYALLDKSGICQAFRHCTTPPIGHGWVEINEVRLSWLQQPLPASARVGGRDAAPRHRQFLAT